VILGFCLASGGVYSGLATFGPAALYLGCTRPPGAFALINFGGQPVPALWGRG
jgi:hypothetical protein